MSSKIQLDPYMAQAQNDDVSALQKIEGVYAIRGSLRKYSSIGRFEQDHARCANGYANHARRGRPSPFESNDTRLP
jgi:hypothetical protein